MMAKKNYANSDQQRFSTYIVQLSGHKNVKMCKASRVPKPAIENISSFSEFVDMQKVLHPEY